jgi:signal transduction histidine kinase
VVQAFVARINDVSNLILDPDLDSYYMMDASMLILPEQYPRLAEMARQLLAIAPRPGDGMDEIFVETDLRARISAEIGTVRAGLMRHSRGFDVARENNPSRILGPETFEVSGRMVTQVEQFLASVEKLLAQGKITVTDREALLSGSRAALAAMLNLWNHSLEKLDQLLGYRVDGFKSRKIQYLTGVGLLLLAAGLVAFYIGRRLNSRVTQLTRIAHRIADNAEIDAEVDNDLESLASRDEVGDLASTLAVMTIKLRRSFDEIQAKRLELEQANQTLEGRVARRTAEIQAKSEQLEKTLEQLEKTKDQLIVQEKMASLGNLTAGIAHEIKNPLNFVNNFAELSVEIASEIREILDGEREKLSAKVIEDLEMCLDDLEQNVSKIHEHGKRADSIVKGMLQHSRGASGEFVLANINNLLDEYVGLAYHGMRAQDKTFNVTIEKSFDKSLPDIPVVPQDITRVFLNIVNNGCYAANQKKLSGQAPENFMPTISVSTERLPDDRVEIRIRDNGTGMPESVRSKIFEPFFTTKPTGIGTGLGLSLSYDIVVKEHGGSLQVETTEGEGTEFIITLPMKREIATA